MTIAIRLILTTALLTQVWRHTHWSVGLCLTLLALTIEGAAWVARARVKRMGELVDKFVAESAARHREWEARRAARQ